MQVENAAQLRLEGVHVTRGIGQLGGGCALVQGRLIARNSRFSHCSALLPADDARLVGGGGVLVVDSQASLEADHVSIEDCRAEHAGGGAAYGGGVAVANGGEALLRDVRLLRTQARSVSGRSYGGALGNFAAGTVRVYDSELINTSAYSATSNAFGGGVGIVSFGMAQLRRVRMLDTTAYSSSHMLLAWGGGLGLEGGTADACDCEWVGTRAICPLWTAWGGGVGLHFGGTVTVHDSTTPRRCQA